MNEILTNSVNIFLLYIRKTYETDFIVNKIFETSEYNINNLHFYDINDHEEYLNNLDNCVNFNYENKFIFIEVSGSLNNRNISYTFTIKNEIDNDIVLDYVSFDYYNKIDYNNFLKYLNSSLINNKKIISEHFKHIDINLDKNIK
jgi:hypothetical protein